MRCRDINFAKSPRYVEDWRKVEAYPSCHQERVYTLNTASVHHRTNTETQMDKQLCAHSPIFHLIVEETHKHKGHFISVYLIHKWLPKKAPSQTKFINPLF